MSGNSFGHIFKITNWGESHGGAIGVVIDGCPPKLSVSTQDIQKDLNRRRPGQSKVTTPRKEQDNVEILSGVLNGKTTGAPISLMIRNTNQRKKDYHTLQNLYRPSHADFTYEQKYGIRDPYGGGRSSARLTAGNVAAGSIAKKILNNSGMKIQAYVKQIHNIKATISKVPTTSQVEASLVRCPDKQASKKMINLISKTKQQGDSLGGVIECVVTHAPPGLGAPLFDRLDADLAKAMLSINATKGFEIGSGFSSVNLFGSQHNDAFTITKNKVRTKTNHSGGIQGGISNGMPIVFRVAFKPTSTIAKKQKTVNTKKKQTTIEAQGRHDPCVLPRAVPIVEAMAALVLCDHYLLQKTMKP